LAEKKHHLKDKSNNYRVMELFHCLFDVYFIGELIWNTCLSAIRPQCPYICINKWTRVHNV